MLESHSRRDPARSVLYPHRRTRCRADGPARLDALVGSGREHTAHPAAHGGPLACSRMRIDGLNDGNAEDVRREDLLPATTVVGRRPKRRKRSRRATWETRFRPIAAQRQTTPPNQRPERPSRVTQTAAKATRRDCRGARLPPTDSRKLPQGRHRKHLPAESASDTGPCSTALNDSLPRRPAHKSTVPGASPGNHQRGRPDALPRRNAKDRQSLSWHPEFAAPRLGALD